MPKVLNVVVWTAAAVVTVAIEVVGLHRAIAVRDEIDTAPSCPVAVPDPPPAPAAQAPATPAVLIRVLSVRDDAVDIEVGGRRHELPGYPPPRAQIYTPGRLTTAVVAPDGTLLARAGECHEGDDGCVPAFIRLYRVDDGSHVRDLKVRWESDEVIRRPLAIAFDERTERLAVLVHTSWSDCMWDGERIELSVFRLSDGVRVLRRVLETEATRGRRSLTFRDGEVHVKTDREHRRPKVRVVRVPDPA